MKMIISFPDFPQGSFCFCPSSVDGLSRGSDCLWGALWGFFPSIKVKHLQNKIQSQQQCTQDLWRHSASHHPTAKPTQGRPFIPWMHPNSLASCLSRCNFLCWEYSPPFCLPHLHFWKSYWSFQAQLPPPSPWSKLTSPIAHRTSSVSLTTFCPTHNKHSSI